MTRILGAEVVAAVHASDSVYQTVLESHEALRAALAWFGNHRSDCAVLVTVDGDCSCGYIAALLGEQ